MEYKTIGDVAKIIGIEAHVLRFWEGKFPAQIKPKKRKGGHRYYSSQDVENIKIIKDLLYNKKFTIAGAKKHFSNTSSSKEDLSTINNLTSIKTNINKALKLLKAEV